MQNAESIEDRYQRLKGKYGDLSKPHVDGIDDRKSIFFMKDEIKANDEVLNILENKLKVPVKGSKSPYFEKNNSSSLKDLPFVREKVGTYVKDGVVEKLDHMPWYCNPLSVASKVIYRSNDLKKRLVIDVSRKLNLKVPKMTARPDTLDVIEQQFSKGMWASTLDLRAMYHHLELAPESMNFFGFRVRNENGNGHSFYRFRKLPFGFINSGAIMHKITAPIVRYLRAAGVNMSIYIDDILILGDSEKDTQDKVKLCVLVFTLAGYAFAWDKCCLAPGRKVEYLGFQLDFEKMAYSIDPCKKQFIQKSIIDILQENTDKGSIPTRKVAEVLGKLISIKRALGPIILVILRHVQHELGRAVLTENLEEPFWDGNMVLDEQCEKELTMAAKVLQQIESRSFPSPQKRLIFSLQDTPYEFQSDLKYDDSQYNVFVSDASAEKAFIYEAEGFKIVEDYFFDPIEAQYGSGRRELLAISKTLRNRADFFDQSKKNIFWITDSKNVFFWLRRGSRNADIQAQVLDIKTMELQLQIEITPIWQPRTSAQIFLADLGSKMHFSTDEWAISDPDFDAITGFFGVTPLIDGFASKENSKCRTFFSKVPQVGSAGITFFSQVLTPHQVYWLTPPVTLVVKTCRYITEYGGPICAIVNIPEWKSSVFWPFIVRGGFFAPFIRAVKYTNAFFIAYNQSSNIFSGKKNFRLISLLIDTRFNDNKVLYR